MSPIAKPPFRGYDDYQRTANMDDPVLFAESAVVHSLNFTTPVLDVQRYAYIGGFDNVSTAMCNVEIAWWLTPSGTQNAGQRNWTLDSVVDAIAQYRIINLGPFVTFTWATTLAGAFTHSCRLFPTNRQFPVEMIPTAGLLVDQQATTIGASSTNTHYPQSHYAGPVDVWFECAASPLSVTLLSLTTAGSYDPFSRFDTATGNNAETRTVPPGAWRVDIGNSGAATSYNLTVTPSTTGST